jgi:thioredoxin reductase
MLVAAGASEKVISFPGWTLPGVMGAGAAQTLINVHRVLPGRKVLMIGSGNVGLIVGYQLLQAGAQVSMVEALPAIGGYRVHADKIRRAGVPVFLSHSIKEGLGKEFIEGAVIHRLDRSFKPIPGTEKVLDVDTICLAVGLVPQVELLSQAGCKMIYSGRLGGFVPIHSPFMQTTEPDLFVAGDSAGIGEASSAMEEGRLAGLTMAKMLGSRSRRIEDERRRAQQRLGGLRKGPFGQPIRQAKEEVLKAWKKERIKTEIPKQVRDDIDRRSLLAV